MSEQHILSFQFDLEPFRHRVKKLYIDEKRPLKDVIDILKEEGCYASRAMFLKKIRAWGLNKNRHREDRPRTAEVNSLIGERVLHLGQMTKQVKDRDLTHEFFQTLYDIQRCTVSKNVVRGVAPDHQDPVLSQFYHSLLNGTSLMAKDEIEAGAALLERGLQAAESAMIHMTYSFIHHTIFIIVSMTYHRTHKLSHVFIQFIYQLSRKVLGNQHSFTRLFKILSIQQEEQQEEDRLRRHQDFLVFHLGHQGLRIASDATAQVAGRLSRVSINLREVKVISNRMVYTSVPEICSEYEALIRDCDEVSFLDMKIKARRNYAVYLHEIGRTSEGIPLLREGASLLFQEPLPTSYIAIRAAVQSCYEWGCLVLEQPPSPDPKVNTMRRQEAEEIIKMAVEQSILLMGPQDLVTVMASQTLAEFYKLFGHPEEEASQRAFVLEQLAQFKLG